MMQSISATRFGRGGVNIRSMRPEGLTDEEIMARAPSVFADDKHVSRSERYTFIPTRDLLTGLRRAGLVPVEVRQGGTGDAEKRGFTKHMIRMRRAGDTNSHDMTRGIGDVVPEVIALNSHDGTSAYALEAGLFRKVCMNGLHVSAGTLESIRIPHKGDVIGQVIEGAYRVIEHMPAAVDAARAWEGVRLSPDEQNAFAASAAALRFEPGAPQPEARRLNFVRRYDDEGADLWRTFNRVQENLVRGGVGYEATNSQGRREHRATRPVRSIDGDRNLNRALWLLGEEMAKLKAAA